MSTPTHKGALPAVIVTAAAHSSAAIYRIAYDTAHAELTRDMLHPYTLAQVLAIVKSKTDYARYSHCYHSMPAHHKAIDDAVCLAYTDTRKPIRRD